MTGINVPVGNVVDRVGDARVDGLIGLNWGSNNLSYSDPNSPSDYGAFYPVPILSVTQISSGQLLAVQWALDANGPIASNVNAGVFSVEAFTNANFDYRGGGTGAAVLRFANSEDPGTAYSFMPQQGDVRSGDVFFGGSGRLPVHGTADYLTILQQAAHGLGLKYAHDASQWGPVSAAWDALEYTVMSFRSYVGAEIGEYSNEIGGMPQTYMMGDIRALQQQYGADFSTNAGATVYSWSPTTGDAFVNGARALDPLQNRIFMTIWDGGGYDTYDLSNYSSDLRIDLTPGGSSKFADVQLAALGDGHYARGNVYNALQYQNDPRSLIEAVIGGSGDDDILGNAADNAIEGGDGDDVLSGGAGNDAIDGNGGNDTIYGGPGNDDIRGGAGNDVIWGNVGDDIMGGDAGNDTYHVDSLSDFVFEFAGEGTDTVISTVVHTLGDNFENLTLVGSFATGGTGNALANRIAGSDFAETLVGLGGADTLVGNGGADFLRGGDGRDILVGGVGADVLMGGRGPDVFDFDAAAHSPGAARDILRAADGGVAFDGAGSAAGDLIDLAGIDADATRSGNQAFAFGRTGAGGLSVVESGGNTLVRGNTDGDAAFEFQLLIEDGGVLAAAYRASDFVL
ncbi:M10 family metallopeptidase C-terminal domain-containing protein [Amaricoccus sp.]|uniref:M10 family metallopeptidase C-terminal domain-containing protein n=1 Tax=Amaricoccus sp. TaxID=1872485 RepID=UPI001B63599B|nr:M10 family metallopeptidase C-terminal domain-containing protein [Amaricoccus sp.]MBP7240795.1 M10 family metallopeptidase C-terminal domain-containing protein [Amaricoccus sp.]